MKECGTVCSAMGSGWHNAFALLVLALFATVCSGLTPPRARYCTFHATRASRVFSPSLSDVRDRQAVFTNDADLRDPLPSRLSIPVAAFAMVFTSFRKACVAAATKNPIVGWGQYGRVPYDDFLFSNDKLLDPNFLRKSIVEAVCRSRIFFAMVHSKFCASSSLGGIGAAHCLQNVSATETDGGNPRRCYNRWLCLCRIISNSSFAHVLPWTLCSLPTKVCRYAR